MSLMRVRDLMTTEVFTLDPDRDFVSADQLMRLRHVRHVPIVKAGALIGLVTHRDLMRAEAKLLLDVAKLDRTRYEDEAEEEMVSVRIGDYMTEGDLATCAPSTPADDAARLMLTKKIGCVLVVDEGRLVGILTESDLVSWSVDMMAKQRLEEGGATIPRDSESLADDAFGGVARSDSERPMV